MKERKYKEDWRLETRLDASGREKRIPVYQGAYYTLNCTQQQKNELIVCSAVCFVVIFAVMFLFLRLNLPASRCIYVLPVSLCILFPLLYWAMGLFAFARAPERMTSLQKENGIGRLSRSAFGCLAVSVLALLGNAVFAVVNRFPQEWPDCLCFTIASLSSYYAWLRLRSAYRKVSAEVSVE